MSQSRNTKPNRKRLNLRNVRLAAGNKNVLVTLYRQPGKIDPSSRLSVDRNITGAPDIIGYFELEI
jgi:hypothetical protein